MASRSRSEDGWSRKEDESGNATAPSPLKGPSDGSEDDEFEFEVLRRLTVQQNSLTRLQWRVLFLVCFFLGAALAVLLLT